MLHALASLCLGLAIIPFVQSAAPAGFPYGSEKVRGVSLGGWLVLEPWITPSIFDNAIDPRVVDEYTFGQYVPRGEASDVLQNHWETWITEQDFQEIAAAKLNHVRIPIGYWAYDVSGGEPFVQGQLPYLERAIGWAQQYGLKVILDLHGAPGSQNGYDNSGQKLPAPLWHTKPENIQRTEAIVARMEAEYKDMTSVVSVIAPLNEPAGYRSQALLDVTKRYWKDTYKSIRFPYGSSRESGTVALIHDAFQGPGYWNGFMPPNAYDNVMIDTHIYSVFSPQQNAWSQQQHIAYACGTSHMLRASQLRPMVGEWSTAQTDCARYLNGRGVGARYDGSYPGSTRVGSCAPWTGSSAGWDPAFKVFLRKNYEAQTQAYEAGGSGWVMWTWKTEEAEEWSYQAGLHGGWIPWDPAQREYPHICG